jgi:hypothetical protein
MIYSDEELKRWWHGLSETRRVEILARMVDKMDNPDFALSLSNQYAMRLSFTPKQLASIRKWDI